MPAQLGQKRLADLQAKAPMLSEAELQKRQEELMRSQAELEQLVQWMMTISCQKFIWNPKIRSGKVTILSPEKVTLREAYAAHTSDRQFCGIGSVKSGIGHLDTAAGIAGFFCV